MIPQPSVYRILLKSRLIPEGNLQTALAEFLNGRAGAPESTPEQLDRDFLEFLVAEGALNRWQVSQLQQGRTRFRLGNYRIIDTLGSGGYGYVFLARTDSDTSNFNAADSNGKRPYDYAVKTLIRSEKHGQRAVERFRRESEINRLFVHPNLVRLREADEDGNVCYAVYEYMDGQSAFQLVTNQKRLSGRAASYIISETAKGLFHLHQYGFIHRDVKPGNILFTRGGEVKLGDLGLAAPMNAEKFRPLLGPNPDDFRDDNPNSARVAGTSDYLPPDQILSPNTPNVSWDIYSLGCTFFFLVAGFVPFPSGTSHQKLHAHLLSEAPDPKMYSPELPWEVARLISAMMDKNPENRPATAEEVFKALAPFAAGGRSELKTLLKQSLAPVKAKREYQPEPGRFVRDASDSAILDALSEEASEALSAYQDIADESVPPVIELYSSEVLRSDDSDVHKEDSAPEAESPSWATRALAPLLWLAAALALALFAALLFR
ncbi:MAG: serine/threonine protein kinase [Thermoguttaceae bacterium]|nr:serine/threonine protein kinase [Thermoguttaceae bacterium]